MVNGDLGRDKFPNLRRGSLTDDKLDLRNRLPKTSSIQTEATGLVTGIILQLFFNPNGSQ